jgi:hypothetical protein
MSTGRQPQHDSGLGIGQVATDYGRFTVTDPLDAQRRVDQAHSLAEVLDAAYDAFEITRSAIHRYHQEGGPFYPALIMATGAAADGRDSIACAPSLPPPSLPPPSLPRQTAGSAPGAVGWQDLAASVAELSSAVARKLRAAIAVGTVLEDRRACLDAAMYADEIKALATGSPP